MKISVVIPARNEEANVEKMVTLLMDNLRKQILEIIVVNDCSTDKTGELLNKLAKKYTKLKPIHRRKNGGVGNAIREGLVSVSDKTEYVLMLDCDFVENVGDVKKLIEASGNYDGLLGSRYMEGGGLIDYPTPKKVANRVFHMLARFLLRIKNIDVTNNFRLYKYEIIDHIRPLLKSSGFSVNAETGLYPILLGYKIHEVPVTWHGRTQEMGKSAFNVARAGPGYINVLWNAIKLKYFDSGKKRQELQKSEREHFDKLVQNTGETYYGNLRPVAKIRFQRKSESVINLIKDIKNPKILELGCGTGTLSNCLLKKDPGLNIVGLDISPAAIKTANRKLKKYKNARFEVGDVLRVSYPNNYFDEVIGNSILHHVPLDIACKEIRRVLKPGGVIWFCEPNALNPQIAIEKNTPILKHLLQNSSSETAFFRWSLKRALQRSGFRNVSVEPYEFLHPLLPRFGLDALVGLCILLEKVPGVRELAGTLQIKGVVAK